MGKPDRIAVVTAKEVPGILELERLCFSAYLPEETFTNAVGDKGSYFRFIGDETTVKAFLLATFTDFEGEIVELAVHPKYRRQGLASRLIEDLCGFLGSREALYLEVRADNEAALSLYKALGFEQYSRRSCYYRDGTDAVLERKRLHP